MIGHAYQSRQGYERHQGVGLHAALSTWRKLATVLCHRIARGYK